MARILYFSRNYNVHDHRFLSVLANTEHEIHFMQLERGTQIPEIKSLPTGVEAISWSEGRGIVRVQDLPKMGKDLDGVIQKLKPDLIHAGPIQRPAYLVALSGFQPLVSMSWGYDLIVDAKRDRKWEEITRFTLENSSVMVGDCATIRQLAVSYGMPGERIVTFPWGIDLEHFSPDGQKPSAATDTFTLLSTRNWEPIYGVDVIARGFAQAAKFRPELQLFMLGGGSQASLLQRIFEQAGVSEQVHYPGQIHQEKLPDLYRAADLYISATHSDGTSISLLEALGCGCPVLVSDIPGNCEWIEPNVQGWLFPEGDHEALAGGILNALEQRDHLQQIGHNGRALAEQRADWSVNFKHLLHAYQLALN